jgi:hypothetical protein
MSVLATIMNDEAAPPKVRAMAARSILVWGGDVQRQPSATRGARKPRAVGVEWAGTPRAD